MSNDPSMLQLLPAPAKPGAGWPWTAETEVALYSSPPPGGWPKISIVCPSFRQGRFIEETIRSVLLQNYPALEFIVMDGGSDDETVPLLKKYSPWLAHWESRRDRGQSHALNRGFARATGEIFGWINSDDYYLPGAFAAVARAFRASRRPLLFGDWCERDGDAPALVTRREHPAFAFQVRVGGRTLPSHATFWPRTAHLPVNEALRFTMDADLFKRFAASGLRPRHVAQPLAVFRRHPEAKSSTIVATAVEETAVWGRTQSRSTHWWWLLSRLIDRLVFRT